MEELKTSELLELYKIARNSVEHFDRLLASIRSIIFTFNGVMVGSGLAFYLNGGKEKYAIFFVANFTLAVINILVWLLEKHYHRYLTTSAVVAGNIEKRMLKMDKEISLTFQLTSTRNRGFSYEHTSNISFINYLIERMSPVFRFFNRRLYQVSKYIRSYDLLYILPICGSVILNFIIAISVCNIWLLVYSFILSNCYTFVGFLIIRHNYIFTKHYNLKYKLSM